MIANAGITKDQLTIRMTEEQWDDVLKVLNKHISFISAYQNNDEKMGRIIFLVQLAFGNPGQINYSYSKAAAGVARTIALEYGSEILP